MVCFGVAFGQANRSWADQHGTDKTPTIKAWFARQSTFPYSLYTNFRLLAESRGALVRHADRETHPRAHREALSANF